MTDDADIERIEENGECPECGDSDIFHREINGPPHWSDEQMVCNSCGETGKPSEFG
jgi:hypothetical protein